MILFLVSFLSLSHLYEQIAEFSSCQDIDMMDTSHLTTISKPIAFLRAKKQPFAYCMYTCDGKVTHTHVTGIVTRAFVVAKRCF